MFTVFLALSLKPLVTLNICKRRIKTEPRKKKKEGSLEYMFCSDFLFDFNSNFIHSLIFTNILFNFYWNYPIHTPGNVKIKHKPYFPELQNVIELLPTNPRSECGTCISRVIKKLFRWIILLTLYCHV